MKRKLSAVLLLALLGLLPASGRPIEFSEVSLLVRAHESSPEIMQEVQTRKLLHPLTAQQADTLKAQGADDALLRKLRQPNLALSPEEAAMFDQERQAAKKSAPPRAGHDDSLGQNIHVFDVAYGHPVNLSQWGGPSYEIAFQLRRYAGEDIVEPILLDSYTSVATYRGQGRPDDSTTIFDQRDYRSVVSYDRSQPGSIDTANPVTIKGVPYLLYPVSGAGGVSLYYIGKSGDSVRLAVMTTRL
jgi:hypothetical protein